MIANKERALIGAVNNTDLLNIPYNCTGNTNIYFTFVKPIGKTFVRLFRTIVHYNNKHPLTTTEMRKRNRYITGFLYSDNSFLAGAATSFNLAGNFYEYNLSDSDQEADSKAISNDFAMVGQDISDSLAKLKSNG